MCLDHVLIHTVCLLQNWFDIYFPLLSTDNAEMIDMLIEQHGLSPTEKMVQF